MNFVTTPLHMLVVAPHPDDAEIFCGGLILSLISRGYDVGIVDLSLAELSTLGDPQLRIQETKKATELLGIKWRKNLELPNCWFHEHMTFEKLNSDNSSAVCSLSTVIRSTRPEIVLAPYPHDRHPDHIQSGMLTLRSLFMAGLEKYTEPKLPPYTPKQVFFYQFRTEFTPSFVVDITKHIDHKYKVINCYASQLTENPNSQMSTLLSSNLCLHSLRARDAYYGSFIGTEYGEAYLGKSMIRIDDIIAHARNNPTCDAQFFKDIL